MARISQLIAVVGGVAAEADKKLGEFRALSSRDDLLSGSERTYRPRIEGGVQLPPKSQKVRLTEDTVLQAVQVLLARKWDLAATLDNANSNAYGDVMIGGHALLEQVPVGHLLYLEKELAGLYSLVEGMPTLDQTKDWTDEGTAPGLHRSVPVETASTDKLPYNHVLSPATAQHPAQVQLMTRDEVVGYWTTVTFSGALHPRRKSVLLDRISELRNAVKMAREEANSESAEDVHEGLVIFEWLLRP
jgi:hypothetical protein